MEEILRRGASRHLAIIGSAFVLAANLSLVGGVPAHATTFDPTSAEQQLFTLINQDRAQNGLPALTANPTMFSIARGATNSVCGGGLVIHGRSQDMIERGYFSHQIPPCNSYVWPILQSFGVNYTSAGENIAWNTSSPQSTSVDGANTQFMNSAPHRANILGDYNQVGVGAWAAPGPWSDGSGGPYNGVIMYTEIFAKVAASAPAAPAGVTAVPSNGGATVSWTAPADGGSALTGYTVTPYANGVALAALSFSPTSTSVAIPALVNGTSYTFTVSATNAVGSGPASGSSNAVVPLASFPWTAVTTGQYQLTNSDGQTWVEMDPARLRLSVAPTTPSTATLSANADLWTAQAGVNQDLGIFVSAGGGADTLVAWKESGGSAGTFSPNAAFVQGTVAMSAGTTYTVKLKWKTNMPDSGTIFAGAGPIAGQFSPTRLTALLATSGVSAAVSTTQYHLAGSDGTSWTDLDPGALASTITPVASGTLIISGNADLWTANAGYNQDLAIFVSGGAYGAGRVVAWKESGGYAGTFSPNAALVQASIPVTAATAYQVRLQWKTNKPAGAATIFAGAGPIAGQFSPTSLLLRAVPSTSFTSAAVSTAQYQLAGSDGSTWADIDAASLVLTVAPSTGSCLAILTGNADLWTATAGLNQDLAIDVNGNTVGWKESGGFAGTFSPNAAMVQAVTPMVAGSSYTVKLRWKANRPAGGGTIYAGAGPIAGQFSPTSLSAQLVCG